MTMDYFRAVKERRSIRSFSADPVPRATVMRLVEAAAMAPSAGNVQPWHFYVVEDARLKRELAIAALNQLWLARAPVVIVVCADLARSQRAYGERGRTLYAFQDTAAATQNILLGATALGLAACWVGAFNEKMVAAALAIDDPAMVPVAMVPLGHPAGREAQVPARRAVEDIVTIIAEGGR